MKKINFFLIPLLFLILLPWLFGRHAPPLLKPSSSSSSSFISPNYYYGLLFGKVNAALDHYEVVFTWSPSFCAINFGECKSGIRDDFHLHSIWPLDRNGDTPTPCRQPLDPSAAINSLRRRLTPAWLSLLTLRTEDQLWRDEWRLHGRCGRLPPQDYFQLAIDFHPSSYQRYLRDAGITSHPTTQRTKTIIENAIKAGRGRSNDHVYISCAPSRNKNYLLYQIHICLDANTNPASCARPNLPGDCIYPPSTRIVAAAGDMDATNEFTA